MTTDLEQARAVYRAAAVAGDSTALVASWHGVFDRARQIEVLAIDSSAARIVQADHDAATRRAELALALEEEGQRRAELALAQGKLLSLNVLDPARYQSRALIAEEEAVERAEGMRLQALRQSSDAARGATQARADAAALAAPATRSSRTQEALEAAMEGGEQHRGAFLHALADGVTHSIATREAALSAYAASQAAAASLDVALRAAQSTIASLDSLDRQRYQLETRFLPVLERSLREAQDLTSEMGRWVGESKRACREAAARRNQCIAQASDHLDRWLNAFVPTLPPHLR